MKSKIETITDEIIDENYDLLGEAIVIQVSSSQIGTSSLRTYAQSDWSINLTINSNDGRLTN